MPITITRSILVVFIPGIVALLPLIVYLITQHSELVVLYKDYFYLFNVVLAGAAIIVGTVLEGVGTYKEHSWDNQLETEYQVMENWHAYLALSTINEPVGFRYLSRLATTMYFELGMLYAAPIFCLGAVANLYINAGTTYATYNALLILISLIIAGFFYWQAKNTHKLLCETRKALNARMAN